MKSLVKIILGILAFIIGLIGSVFFGKKFNDNMRNK